MADNIDNQYNWFLSKLNDAQFSHKWFKLVSSPDPTLKRREKGLVTLGKKLGPVDDPRRNLRVPIRLQL
ncbi:MAG: hypothetical protein MJE68_04390 [Proteobacteria bacterium]|nr:hypothetical protein [Pseudomonadota bacterium]